LVNRKDDELARFLHTDREGFRLGVGGDHLDAVIALERILRPGHLILAAASKFGTRTQREKQPGGEHRFNNSWHSILLKHRRAPRERDDVQIRT
jgi:hypothetical protein